MLQVLQLKNFTIIRSNTVFVNNYCCFKSRNLRRNVLFFHRKRASIIRNKKIAQNLKELLQIYFSKMSYSKRLKFITRNIVPAFLMNFLDDTIVVILLQLFFFVNITLSAAEIYLSNILQTFNTFKVTKCYFCRKVLFHYRNRASIIRN